MEATNHDIIIIGAGLTGLTLSYLLRDEDVSVKVLEARSELGGRIKTIRKKDHAPLEMGATWFGIKHTEVNKLLSELGIEPFIQKLGETAIYEPLSTSPPQLVKIPANEDDVSFRIKNGTSTITEYLHKNLGENCTIDRNQKVIAIKKIGDLVHVNTESNAFNARKVISTLPPHLLLRTIAITPELPNELVSVMEKTHTWMGESIKVGLYFKDPFWQDAQTSGTIFSNVGPIPEMYDHSNFEESRFALKGFLNGSYHAVSKEERLQLILAQLRTYFGNIVDDYLDYEEQVWRQEELTFHSYSDDVLPHQNNGHPVFNESYLEDSLHIAGAETAAHFPGYMEGAIRSAKNIAKTLIDKFIN